MDVGIICSSFVDTERLPRDAKSTNRLWLLVVSLLLLLLSSLLLLLLLLLLLVLEVACSIGLVVSSRDCCSVGGGDCVWPISERSTKLEYEGSFIVCRYGGNDDSRGFEL